VTPSRHAALRAAVIDLRLIRPENCGGQTTLEITEGERIECRVEIGSLTGKELAQSRIVDAQLRVHTGALHRDQRILEAVGF